jgi:hypothetical protein
MSRACDAVARPEHQPKLENALSDGLCVAGVAVRQPIEPLKNAQSTLTVLESSQP